MIMKTKRFLLVLLFICAGMYGTLAQNPQKYAVIITGDSPGDGYQGQFANPNSNYNEFWNDTYLMWEMLVTKFGFDHNKVFVLYAEGSDYASQNPRYTVAHSGLLIDHITDFPATVLKVNTVLSGLADGSNGIPQVTADDFLFVFTFGHGLMDQTLTQGALQLQDGIMIDTQFGQLVKAIPANKRVIWMQNCTGGDFADELTDSKNYFVAATQPYPTGALASPADDCYKYQNMNYCNIPNLENEVISGHVYNHGEFIFHQYSAANGATPDGDTYYVASPAGNYTNVDVNQDGYKTFLELFNYVDINDSQGTDDPFTSDFGLIGSYTSFEWPTLLHDNIVRPMICQGSIGISNTTHVKSGQTLTFNDNAEVHLLNGGSLIVDPGATLVVHNNVHFYKDLPESENKIEINGTMSACSNATFNGGGSGQMFEINTTNNSGTFTFTNCTFNNCAVKGTSGTFSIDGCNFYGSYCTTGNTFLEDNLVNIRNSTFAGNNIAFPAISINNKKRFIAVNNQISYYKNGIEVYFSGRELSPYFLGSNSITNCYMAGLRLYNSRVTVTSNTITNNYTGIDCLNNSIAYIYGSCPAASVSQTQQISYNTSYEVNATNLFPVTFRYNAIQDYDLSNRIKYNTSQSYDVANNYWGANIGQTQMQTILNPYASAVWQPLWSPGSNCNIGGGGGNTNASLKVADSMYQAGLKLVDEQSYSLAKDTFLALVNQYTATAYAQSALYELFFLESKLGEKYNDLKDYYSNDPVLVNDTNMAKVASFLANQCNMEMKNYSEAIAWFEGVINHPATFNDSVFAIIDLGYTYLLAETDTLRSCPIGQLQMYKPESRPEFIKYRDYLLSLVNQGNQVLPGTNPISKICLIKSIDPNPAHESVSVHFDLGKEGDVSLAVKNTLGQITINLPVEHFVKGTHSIPIHLNTIAPGAYFITISVNNNPCDSYKFIKN